MTYAEIKAYLVRYVLRVINNQVSAALVEILEFTDHPRGRSRER
jgi:hypothetical protein